MDIFEVLGKMRIKKLALAPTDSADMPPILRHPAFVSVTHLDLYVEEPDVSAGSWEEWSPLAALPALTHLCFSESLARVILPEIGREFPRPLRVVTAYRGLGRRNAAIVFVRSLAIEDSRVVVMVIGRGSSFDWKRGARRGDDFWVRAEDF